MRYIVNVIKVLYCFCAVFFYVFRFLTYPIPCLYTGRKSQGRRIRVLYRLDRCVETVKTQRDENKYQKKM